MNQPKVTIIITTYHPSSLRYLDMCVGSIKELNYPKNKIETFIVTRKLFRPHYEDVTTICVPEESFYPARAINYASGFMAPDSEYIFTINDDVILTNNSLSNMIKMMNLTRPEQRMILNGISPCDNYALNYALQFGYFKENAFYSMPDRFYIYEDLAHDFEYLVKASSLYQMGYIKQDYLCFYATLIPRDVWNEVGLFDEGFKLGQDDIDYSWRAKKCGVKLASCLDALIWHFGGEAGSKNMSDELRMSNVKYFEKKWGVLPP